MKSQMKQQLINYIMKPEKVNENIMLIKNVFKQLQAERPIGIKYAAYKMSENIFVHVAQFEIETAHDKFTPSARRWQRGKLKNLSQTVLKKSEASQQSIDQHNKFLFRRECCQQVSGLRTME